MIHWFYSIWSWNDACLWQLSREGRWKRQAVETCAACRSPAGAKCYVICSSLVLAVASAKASCFCLVYERL